MTLRSNLIALAGVAIVITAAVPVRMIRSQQLTIQQALQEIRSTAADICQSAPLEQTYHGVTLSGDANAKIAGLLGKLADLGITGAGKYEAGNSQGVLQKDLITAILNANDCKLQVFKALYEKLLDVNPSNQRTTSDPTSNRPVVSAPKGNAIGSDNNDNAIVNNK